MTDRPPQRPPTPPASGAPADTNPPAADTPKPAGAPPPAVELRPGARPVPEAEWPAVARALAKDPKERFPTCKAFAEALASPLVVPSPPPEDLTPTWRTLTVPRPRPRGRRVGFAAVLLVFAALTAVVAVVALIPRGAEPQAGGGTPATEAGRGNPAPTTPPAVAAGTVGAGFLRPNPPTTANISSARETTKGPKEDTEVERSKNPDKRRAEPVASLRLLPPEPVSVQEGHPAVLAVKVRRENCPGPVALRLTGLPAGVRWSPDGIPAGENDIRLELTADAGTPPAAGEATLTARAGGLSHSVRFRFAVNQFTNEIGMTLVRIPAGRFFMGSSEEDIKKVKEQGGDAADEGPRREVQISRPFFPGKYEVTRGQFRQFVESDGYKTEAESSGVGSWGGTRRPRSSRRTRTSPGATRASSRPTTTRSSA